MAVALLGYFTAMVTAFFGFMFLLSSVLSSSFVQQAHLRRPYPMPSVVATATIPEERQQPAISAEQLARTEMAKQADERAAKATAQETKSAAADQETKAAAEKSKRAKIAARSQKRKQDFAGRQQDRDYSRDREYSMALGYAQDGQRQYGGGPFGVGQQFGGGQSGGMFGQFGARRF